MLLIDPAGLQVKRCFHHLSLFALCRGNFAKAIKLAYRETRHPSLDELVQRGANCASISIPGTCVTDNFAMMLFSSISMVNFRTKNYLEAHSDAFLLLPGQQQGVQLEWIELACLSKCVKCPLNHVEGDEEYSWLNKGV